MHVCTTCMIVSLLTTCLNLKTPPLAHVAPCRCKIRESNAEVPLDTKLSKHVCQLILVCTTLRFQGWSNCTLTIPECQNDHHGLWTSTNGPDKASAPSIILALHWALKVLRHVATWRQSVHKNSLLLVVIALLLALLFALALLLAVMIRPS